MTRTWLVLGSLAAILAVGFGTINVIGLLAHEERTETATFAAGGVTRLDLVADNGSVEVVGADTDEITVIAEISHGLSRTRHRAAIEGDTLVVRSSCPWISEWCSVDYRIEVPAELDVQLDIEDGRLAVRDVAGAVRVDGDSDSIELTRLAGDVEASTDDGNVVARGLRSASVQADSDNGRVSLTFASAPTTVQASTDHGRVEVVVPDGSETYRVDLETDFGSTDIGVRTDPDSSRRITGSSDSGDVTVRYPTG